jgi:hypothetical protein
MRLYQSRTEEDGETRSEEDCQKRQTKEELNQIQDTFYLLINFKVFMKFILNDFTGVLFYNVLFVSIKF